MKTTVKPTSVVVKKVMPNVIPHISMNPRHHYVTQSSVWDNPSTGPLTDKKIDKYAKEGKFFVTHADGTVKKKHVRAKTKKVKKVSPLARLLAD